MVEINIKMDDCIEHNVTPNQYYICYLIHHKLFDELKEFKKIYKKNLFFNDDILNLVLSGYLNNPSDDIKKIKISECTVKVLFDHSNSGETEWSRFVNEFRNCFPAGVTSGNYYVRSSYSDCNKKLESFIKKYPKYEKETILRATRNYVQRCQMQGYKFMKIANYFVSKDNESMLASECDAVLDGVSSGGSRFTSGI